MGTLHCKRCKNMWPGDRREPAVTAPCRSPAAGLTQTVIRKKTEPLSVRMQKQLDAGLIRYHGTISMEMIPRACGDIPEALFKKYLRTCVAGGILRETRDRYGRIRYVRQKE